MARAFQSLRRGGADLDHPPRLIPFWRISGGHPVAQALDHRFGFSPLELAIALGERRDLGLKSLEQGAVGRRKRRRNDCVESILHDRILSWNQCINKEIGDQNDLLSSRR